MCDVFALSDAWFFPAPVFRHNAPVRHFAHAQGALHTQIAAEFHGIRLRSGQGTKAVRSLNFPLLYMHVETVLCVSGKWFSQSWSGQIKTRSVWCVFYRSVV